MDEEILQDFLIEAGEILESLSEQLVELEQRPDDYDLLNAIFRGFHTIKGGAGFLGIDPMVECCHITENLFDLLRSGKLRVNSELMDAVLQALDEVQRMFAEVSTGETAGAANGALIERLKAFERGEVVAAASADVAQPQEAPASREPLQSSVLDVTPAGADASEAEFEAMLDAIAPPPAEDDFFDDEPPADDLITDDEFEALLDELHGQGKMSVPEVEVAPEQPLRSTRQKLPVTTKSRKMSLRPCWISCTAKVNTRR